MTLHLVDTSVAVPLVVASHSAHELVSDALGDRTLYLAGHAAAETFSVLTRLPGDSRVAPSDALLLMRERFEGAIALQEDPFDVVARLSEAGVSGGAVYDGLVALTALGVADSLLYSRDGRATATYGRLGVTVVLL